MDACALEKSTEKINKFLYLKYVDWMWIITTLFSQVLRFSLHKYVMFVNNIRYILLIVKTSNS